MTSPTQRTLKQLRKEGYLCQVVERWNAYAKIRQDLFGCIDILCIKPGEILGVQCTSGSNHAKRVKKAKESEPLRRWREAGGHFHVISWKKKGREWVERVTVFRVLVPAAAIKIAMGELSQCSAIPSPKPAGNSR
jgi:hypothetical protein